MTVNTDDWQTAAGKARQALLIKELSLINPHADSELETRQDLLELDGKIAAVQPGLATQAVARGIEVIDGSRWLALPGLVNAHYHSHDALLKGRFDVMSLEKWAFRALPRYFPPRSDRDLRLRTLIGEAECLRSGITTVQDMLSLWPLSARQAEIVRSAYEEAGLRVVLGIQMADVGAVDTIPFASQDWNDSAKGLARGPTPPVDMPDPLAELHRILAMHPANDDGLVSWAVCPSSPERCSRELLMQMRDLAAYHGRRLISHIAISRLEAVAAQTLFSASGGSPVRYLHELGMLGPKTTLAHGVWLDADDLRLLADTDTRMVLNPMSNLKTRNGIARFQDYQRDGVRFGLGCDNCSCSDAQNMFQAMKFATLLSGVNGGMDNSLLAAEAFFAATLGGAHALGLEADIGQIGVGYQADLTFINKDDWVYKPLNDVKRQLVYGEGGRGVASVMVAGRFVVNDGRVLTVDAVELEAELSDLMPVLRDDAQAAERSAQALDELIAQTERRCAGIGVGMRRMIGENSA